MEKDYARLIECLTRCKPVVSADRPMSFHVAIGSLREVQERIKAFRRTYPKLPAERATGLQAWLVVIDRLLRRLAGAVPPSRLDRAQNPTDGAKSAHRP